MKSGATATSAKPPSMQNAATRSPSLHRGALRRAAHHARDLAARHERQRRFELVLPAGLEQLGERDARGADVDHDALGVGQEVLWAGIREL